MRVDETLAAVYEASDDVFEALGPGHSETVYRNAMAHRLAQSGFVCRTEVCCPFMYKGTCVGSGKADIVLNNVIVELKVIPGINDEHKKQVLRYVNALSSLEKKEYVGAVLVLNKHSGKINMYASDSDGDTIFSNEEAKASKANDELLFALLKRYRFVYDTTTQAGISLARITKHLDTQSQDKRAIQRFIKDTFTLRTESRSVGRVSARRVVMCYPKDGASIVLR